MHWNYCVCNSSLFDRHKSVRCNYGNEDNSDIEVQLSPIIIQNNNQSCSFCASFTCPAGE